MTPVIFRRWRDGSVIALFPSIPDTARHCLSYEHIGQHGGASYSHVISMTSPATPEQYAPLLAELQRIGYDDLRVYGRRP